MEFYKRRDTSDYLNVLSDTLQIKNLKKTAYELESGKKVISIDFFGIAATTLFDAGGNYAKANVFNQLKELLYSYEDLNKDGYYIKLRLLFEYPYSISSYSRILAEYTSDRASMTETSFVKEFNHTEHIDLELFLSSRFVSTQKASLLRIQSLMHDLRKKESWSGNKINLRFTPINPSFCCLFINKRAFYDVYLMAKKDRFHNSLEPFAPVCSLDIENEKEEFEAFKDHFRYLWNLDTTMHYKDATKYSENVSNSLAKIKQPQDILNDYRANKILSYIEKFTQEDANTWANVSKKNIQKFCVDLSPITYERIAFVTCSWVRDDALEPSPNSVAEMLVTNMLQKDFYYQRKNIIDFKILRAATTDYLDDQLYSGLDKATLGLIILTKDIKQEGTDLWYSRPNVYHELGYLMNRLSRKKIIILKEEGVVLPSNVQNIPHIPFTKDNLILQYHLIVDALSNISNCPDLLLSQVYTNHLSRLQIAYNEAKFDKKAFDSSKKKLKILLSELDNKINSTNGNLSL